VQNITRQLNDQGTDVVTSGSAPLLKVTLPTLSSRVLGPVSGGDQTELALQMSYSLTSDDLILLIPETTVRATLIYVDGGADTSAEDQRVEQLKRSLESDLLRQIVPSIRVRYEQALKQTQSSQAN
jgi:outer membrane lipopolysaccharide assembly protein LptE/RlpB